MKIYIILFLFFSQQFASTQKAIWVVRDALLSSKDISQVISASKKLNCNRIFLQFRALGSAYYPTKLDIPKKSVDDSLLVQLFLEAARNNIEIHAWLNVCYVWYKEQLPQQRNHIINRTKTALIEPFDIYEKKEGWFLHPNDQVNVSEIKAIIKELIEKYNISGIHLDYFRYPNMQMHASKLGRTEFKIKHGIDPIDVFNDVDLFISQRTYGSYKHILEKYNQFLRDELSAVLSEFKSQINGLDSEVLLSVAVKPNPVSAKHKFFQDWTTWLNKDLCDFVVLMNYNTELSKFVSNLKITEQRTDPLKVIVGVATHNIKQNDVSQRINYINKSKFLGYALFSYNYIKQKTDLYEHLKLTLN